MSLHTTPFGHLKVHQAASLVFIGSPPLAFLERLSVRVSGVRWVSRRSFFRSTAAGVLSSVRSALALSRHPRTLPFVAASRLAHQGNSAKTALVSIIRSNMPLNLAPFGRWTLRDKAAQRRLALRYAAPV